MKYRTICLIILKLGEMTFMTVVRDTVEIWCWTSQARMHKTVHFFTREQKFITIQNINADRYIF